MPHVNAQTERMFGYRHDELVAKSMEMLVPIMMLTANWAAR